MVAFSAPLRANLMSHLRRLIRFSLSLGACGAFAASAHAQFTINNSLIPSGSPGNNSTTENVDFADVDLDGDWDIAMADGGDQGNDQNRIWINSGGQPGGTLGVFVDETAARMPVLSDDSRDIEFVDFDDDGDSDIYISNTAQLSNQGNRWWTNAGGAQGGTAGFYTDDTEARWVDLGTNGSSIAGNQIIGGTFIDWSCDCDFGDLDNDGDMDLVHSSYGGSFNGNVPTRLFLNDGDGFFKEFNPSNFQLNGPSISDNNPGLWCEGLQDSNTTNITGNNCDIASTALDIDVGDIDGDFDLDILHGARNEAPRMFANRLDGSSLVSAKGGGQLAFRDVTGAVFPPNYFDGTSGHYEQEMGDFDGDGDLDIYGLNWRTTGFRFTDVIMTNNGGGVFGNLEELPGSNDDDNEGDFMDVDNDGDLDLYVANFSGQDKLYENTDGQGNFVLGSVPSFGAVALDADACDTDDDGDYDVLVAEDNFQANTFLENTTQIPDTTAPYIPNVEDIGAPVAGVGITFPVRAQVYDNAPYYITWFNQTTLKLSIDGCPLPDVTAKSSGGQIFRAEIPGNLVGDIAYSFESSDRYGNTGVSASTSVTSTTALPFAVEYGTGTPGSVGEPVLDVLTVTQANQPFYMKGKNGKPGTLYIALISAQAAVPPVQAGNVALLNVKGQTLASFTGLTDANGEAFMSAGVIPPTIPPGLTVYAQFAVKDGTVDKWAVSKGVEITTF